MTLANCHRSPRWSVVVAGAVHCYAATVIQNQVVVFTARISFRNVSALFNITRIAINVLLILFLNEKLNPSSNLN